MRLVSFLTLVTLTVSSFALEQKSALVAASPGFYTPIELMEAGLDYWKEEDFEVAAPLLAGAICRAEIDLFLNQDERGSMRDFESYVGLLTGGTPYPFLYSMDYFSALLNFERWDRATPRDYDPRWVEVITGRESSVALSEAEKKQWIEVYYSRYSDLESSCFFDSETRLFTLTNPRVSFTVPQTMVPRVHKEDGVAPFFLFRDKDSYLSFRSAVPTELLTEGFINDEYFYEMEYNEGSFEKCFIRGDIPAYRVRFVARDLVFNHFILEGWPYQYTFKLTCPLSDEAKRLADMDELFDDFTFAP